MEGGDWLKKRRERCACLHGLTFLQSLDLLLCEAGPVPLQLPLELQPQLRFFAIVPLHGDATSPPARSPSPCLSPHAALGVQQAALRHWQERKVTKEMWECQENSYRRIM